MFNNKRGNFIDIPEWIVWTLTFTFLVGIMLTVMNEFNDQVQISNNTTIPQEAKDAHTNLNNSVPNGMDYLFLFGCLVFFVSSLIFARLIPSDPKLAFIAIIFLLVFPLLCMFVENVWDGFNQQSIMASTFARMTFLPFIMDYLTFFGLFYTLAVGVALYTKEGVGG